jgi:hypothetical protein
MCRYEHKFEEAYIIVVEKLAEIQDLLRKQYIAPVVQRSEEVRTDSNLPSQLPFAASYDGA